MIYSILHKSILILITLLFLSEIESSAELVRTDASNKITLGTQTLHLTSEGSFQKTPYGYLDCGNQYPKTYLLYNLDTYFTRNTTSARSKRTISDHKQTHRSQFISIDELNRKRNKERERKQSQNCAELIEELASLFDLHHISYELPVQLGFTPRDPLNFSYLQSNSNTSHNSLIWLNQHLKMDPSTLSIQQIGVGGSSFVFKLINLENGSIRVAKVLRNQDLRRLTAEWARAEVFTGLTESFLVRGKRFLRPALLDFDQLHHGILYQEFISGPQAYDVGKLVLSAQKNDDSSETLSARAELNELGFDTIEDARQQLEVLELFYQASFGVGSKINRYFFNSVGHISRQPTNYYSPEVPFGTPIGFDYNHGHNVIWSPTEKIWVVIDF